MFVELEPFINSSEGYIKVIDNDMQEIRNYIIRMINEYYEAAPGYESALLGHLLSVMPVIFRRNNIKDERIFSKNTLVDEAIRQIRNTIYKNPKPSDIAGRHFVTIDHLGRVFKRETGMTLTQYINKLRVEMAKDILQNTNRPIEHIPEVFDNFTDLHPIAPYREYGNIVSDTGFASVNENMSQHNGKKINSDYSRYTN